VAFQAILNSVLVPFAPFRDFAPDHHRARSAMAVQYRPVQPIPRRPVHGCVVLVMTVLAAWRGARTFQGENAGDTLR
jgi:hypothetical protein